MIVSRRPATQYVTMIPLTAGREMVTRGEDRSRRGRGRKVRASSFKVRQGSNHGPSYQTARAGRGAGSPKDEVGTGIRKEQFAMSRKRTVAKGSEAFRKRWEDYFDWSCHALLDSQRWEAKGQALPGSTP